MALKARPPIIKPNPRVKFMISGKSGAGKTFFALDFPSPYYIDTEGGAELAQYKNKLIASGGMYLGKEDGSGDFNAVIQEIKSLATEKHGFKTLVIDSFSKLYQNSAAIAEDEFGSDFGRDKKEANKPSRQLIRWIDNLDMNVILICHQKDKWERKAGKKDKQEISFAGTTFDGFDKLEYDLDLWIELDNLGNNNRIYTIKKSRFENFPLGETFKLDYKKFASLYGDDVINRDSIPVELASAEQIARLVKLIEVLNIPEIEVNKWQDKMKIDKWEEANSENIQKIMDQLENKLKELQK